jgi:23S rRNA (pseudouridine1915-N3)-methyltransferase
MKIRLLMLGKTRRAEMRALVEDYVKRIGHHSAIEVSEVRDESTIAKRLDANRNAAIVLLDAAGKNLDSAAFAKWIGEQRDSGTREMIFLCGDATGFSEVIRQRARYKIALSAMTFSHELARVALAEQLYRAFAILSGSPYPK